MIQFTTVYDDKTRDLTLGVELRHKGRIANAFATIEAEARYRAVTTEPGDKAILINGWQIPRCMFAALIDRVLTDLLDERPF